METGSAPDRGAFLGAAACFGYRAHGGPSHGSSNIKVFGMEESIPIPRAPTMKLKTH